MYHPAASFLAHFLIFVGGTDDAPADSFLLQSKDGVLIIHTPGASELTDRVLRRGRAGV